MTLYYLGPIGTFSYQAAVQYSEDALVPCQSLYEVIAKFMDDKESKAIVPIENAIEGTINLIADELIENELHVIDELYLDIAFDVVGVCDDLSRAESVVSIGPIISQTKKFITKHELDVKYADSSMDSLNYVTDKTVAIVPHNSQSDYPVLARHVEDYPHNKTRFLIVSHENNVDLREQALVVLTPQVDKAGLLANILNVFNMYNINLSWIESRPTKEQFGNYHFLLQCKADAESEDFKQVVDILSAMKINVRVIGTF